MLPQTFPPLRFGGGLSALVALAFLACSACICSAEDADAVRKLLLVGKYADAADVAGAAEKTQPELEDWPLLRIEALMAVGKYPEAKDVLMAALERFPYALRLRLAGYDVCRANGDTDRAKTLKEEMDRLGGQRDWAYREPPDRVALGKAAILLGADPKRVTELFFDPVKKRTRSFPAAISRTGISRSQSTTSRLRRKVSRRRRKSCLKMRRRISAWRAHSRRATGVRRRSKSRRRWS